MSEIRGIVTSAKGERAKIKVFRTESELTGLPNYLDCWNPISAKVGDRVGAEYRSLEENKAKMIYYGMPVAGVLAGIAFGRSLATFFHEDPFWFMVGGILLWEIVTLSYAKMFKRDAMREGRQPVIYEVIYEEVEIDLNK